MCIIEALIDGLDDSRYAERDELVVEEVDNVCCYCFMPLQKKYEVRAETLSSKSKRYRHVKIKTNGHVYFKVMSCTQP